MTRKKTRAYKEGCSDAHRGIYNNQYNKGSSRYDDYEHGYNETVKDQGEV